MDLSRLPEPLRSKLEARLALLPAAYRHTLEARLAMLPSDQLEAAVAKSSPLLDRLQDRLGTAGLPVAAPPPAAESVASAAIRASESKGHYNATAKREHGDRLGRAAGDCGAVIQNERATPRVHAYWIRCAFSPHRVCPR